jgi:hypothetical protein
MSRALASARQRRAGTPSSTPSEPTNVESTPSISSGLTLPQVITLIDTRLSTLEKFMRGNQNMIVTPTNANPENDNTDVQSVLDEFNNRFLLLAEEIGSIKDTVLKLQMYTMDVNKMLLEERVNVLSDLGSDFTMNITDISNSNP